MNINIKLLLISILIGIIIIYIINPQPQVIFKYPNEKNIYIDLDRTNIALIND